MELDMSNNDLRDSGVKLLSAGLKSPHFQLKILRLAGCDLTVQCCEIMTSVLQSLNSRLIMSDDELTDSGVKLLSDGLKMDSNCQLEILRFLSFYLSFYLYVLEGQLVLQQAYKKVCIENVIISTQDNNRPKQLHTIGTSWS
ncbi:NACHT, LRR and PYD domains-containing protein 9A-like [Pimephales promelas]|uniref:NACHT, LRR and PYD domains-containing protein 9A-like n=1 Tax=Pimephales promelas TaxID=90988 RepID=UPI0019559931|nr:NACHT, LRR and PYD domains-containing protein 9A-like [Pimephales promelas]